MQDLQRIKEYQKRLFFALGKEWNEKLFHDNWFITIYGTEWDKVAEMGLLENDFCYLCGSKELRTGYYRIPSFSYYKVRQPICDDCWERRGFEIKKQGGIANLLRKGCIIILAISLLLIWYFSK